MFSCGLRQEGEENGSEPSSLVVVDHRHCGFRLIG
jgi:hypothetical protein